MLSKKKKPVFVNETDHEVEHNGYIYPSKNYDPSLSSYHAETKHYILQKDGFTNVEIRKMLGVWEILSYRNKHTMGTRWKKLDYTEYEILKYIELYGVI